MAKGNMLQGMARGKVGDVVFSRLNGEQISRVRNRHPKNPRSNKQLYQRAIMATVMQAYSQGQEIFNHSFEGKSVGAENQREFMRLNAKALRDVIAGDIANAHAADNCDGKVTAPGVAVMIPNSYQISDGSVTSSILRCSVLSGDDYDYVAAVGLSPDEDETTLGQVAVNCGLKSGDIYTIVFVIANDNGEGLVNPYNDDNKYNTVFNSGFGWVRLTVKNGIENDTTAVDPDDFDVKYSQLFDIEVGGIANFDGTTTNILTNLDVKLLGAGNFTGSANPEKQPHAMGTIYSREDSGVRSSSTMIVANKGLFGLGYTSLIDAWKAGTVKVGDSDLILEGGDEI